MEAGEGGKRVWMLERYARLTSQIVGREIMPAKDGWEYFDKKDESLQLLVSADQLLVHQGKRQVESLNLSAAGTWVKGVNKGDSLMVVCNLKNFTGRRFRVKFSPSTEKTAISLCRECIDVLAKYFPIKLPGGNETGSAPMQVTSQRSLSGSMTLTDDVTIGQIAQAISSPSRPQMPSPYSRFHDNSYHGDLNTQVKLCLTDPEFPAFVGQVERELEKIKRESC
ncbi:meiotic recombination protein REC114-like [Mya arenaria]|uniref:meiotic recombination protein REC114-like n=1 Tax=Mya arenaria TaxID=6604 RepID=UPI0022E0608F|nr:meiotic recombination protein REC114-like [Mya arenaria]